MLSNLPSVPNQTAEFCEAEVKIPNPKPGHGDFVSTTRMWRKRRKLEIQAGHGGRSSRDGVMKLLPHRGLVTGYSVAHLSCHKPCQGARMNT